ncbi:uncharacterized protein LACBIDRAFT_318400 [Laccaria bicolor S238N-H82]|uniref:Predicted protein n=1 Tax=Laccaria bicolor (strain S238N-H82 / ATCC MYA-4686) TaxID=486041 RepID=B0D6N4_LACBS|nr:uncharacterized protein LACBIDRAFT_318400 [Laccaria bicolor S238N-H82]EDR09985.1 predicted protein [Laccaria bicolor S238N-H82]|eukprot:XP_001879370.1 predicted protein [Laccaria bicolor S238N-H82]
MSKTSVSDHTQASRTHGQKRGRSPSPSPNQGPRGRNRHLANRMTRRGRRSPSPPQQPKQASPTRDTKRRCVTKSGTGFFQAGAAGNGAFSACTICLGRGPHNVFKCESDTLWDGTPARCKKNSNGRLVNPAGNILCSDWQRPNGCSSTTHDSRHECSM